MPLQSSVHIVSRILLDLSEIEAMQAEWRALEQDCADPLTYFQSYDWCRNWLVHHAEALNARPVILTFWRDEVLLAIWPLMAVPDAGVSRLETLGVPHAQYCGMLLRRGEKAESLRNVVRDAIRQSGCDVALMRAVPSGSALAKVLEDVPSVPGSENISSLLDLSIYDSAADYTERLGKLQKRNRNRRRNHLARLGELSFSVLWPDHPDYADLVRQCAQMKRRWISETGRFSKGFSIPGYDGFLAGLPGDEAAKSGACLSVLRAGERVVALEIGFIRQRHYYAYVGSFDWDLRHLSPGKVQMDMTVGWLIDNGIDTYDLMIDPADYKSSWSSSNLTVTSHAEALTWKGQVYAATWLLTVRPALKRIRRRMPHLLQTAFAVLRGSALLLLYV